MGVSLRSVLLFTGVALTLTGCAHSQYSAGYRQGMKDEKRGIIRVWVAGYTDGQRYQIWRTKNKESSPIYIEETDNLTNWEIYTLNEVLISPQDIKIIEIINER